MADRWHLWHNLVESVEKTVIHYRTDLPEPTPEPEPDTADDPPGGVGTPATTQPTVSPSGPAEAQGRLMTRTRERYTAVQDLLTRGVSRSGIARQLRLGPMPAIAGSTPLDLGNPIPGR